MNALEEFIRHTEKCASDVLCAKLAHQTSYGGEIRRYTLPKNYTNAEAAEFFRSINFNYYAGYGRQELYGTIWYTDGTWSERVSYDGSEWWEHKQQPDFDKEVECNE